MPVHREKYSSFSKSTVYAAIAALLLMNINSCTKDKAQKPEPVTCAGVDSTVNTYNLRIANYLDSRCAYSGCHNAATSASGVNLEGYAAAKNAFQNTPVLCAIKNQSGCVPMPPTGKLADSLITYIQCWADNGYPQ